MANSSAENGKFIELNESDVALIFKEDGHVDLTFPQDLGDHVPEHVLAALSLSYALVDDDFFDIIQNRYADQISKTLEEELDELQSLEAPSSTPSKPTHPKPDLKVVHSG